jgi:hypothetical protein
MSSIHAPRASARSVSCGRVVAGIQELRSATTSTEGERQVAMEDVSQDARRARRRRAKVVYLQPPITACEVL